MEGIAPPFYTHSMLSHFHLNTKLPLFLVSQAHLGAPASPFLPNPHRPGEGKLPTPVEGKKMQQFLCNVLFAIRVSPGFECPNYSLRIWLESCWERAGGAVVGQG